MRDFDPKLDQAARIAWMYYIEGQTQDQIARRLGLSRQAAQRALYLARAEGLVKVRLDHPVAECMELAEVLRERFELDYCDVAPAVSEGQGLRALAAIAAAKLEGYLRMSTPLTISVGTGRTMRAMVEEAAHIEASHHRVVGPIGVIAPDGAVNRFDAVTWLADRIGARSYQLPAPVLADSTAEREHIQMQRLYGAVAELAREADVTFMGIAGIDEQAPLRLEGCITLEDVRTLRANGAVGEMTGWVFDARGQLLDDGINERVTSVPLRRRPERPVIGVSGGMTKLVAIRAALEGRWLSGLVTDEPVARALAGQG